MHWKGFWARTFAVVLSLSMLTGNNIAMAATSVADAKSKAAELESAKEEKLKQVIRDSDGMVKEFPNGRFNFLATQYETKEGKKYIEIGVIRQGGTKGKANVRFRAVDVTASYGDDYEIFTSKKLEKNTRIKKGKDARPLIETAYQNETDLSETDSETLLDQAVEKATEKQEKKQAKKSKSDKKRKAEQASPSSVSDSAVTASAVESKELSEVSAGGLKDARSKTSGIESDRKNWRAVADGTVEEAAVREQYDAFLSSVGGSETELTFADGEYIKYLYLVPRDDEISESEEQLIMALLPSDERAPVGNSYTAYVNIKDNDSREKTVYEFAGKEIVTEKDKVSVTVRRTSGIGYYDTIYVGTGEGTANAGADYSAGVKKLDFYAGQTEQKVTIDILDNEYRETDRDFYLLISKDGKSYEDAGCKVTIKGNGKGAAKAQAVEADAEKITTNGAKSATGVWRLGSADFTGFNHPNSTTINANHWSNNWYANTNNLALYGVNSITYHLTNTGSGRTWTWGEKKSSGWWFWKKTWTEWHTEHEDNFYFNFHGQVYWGRQDRESTVSVSSGQWSGGFSLVSVAGKDNNANATISNIRLNLKKYGYQISAAGSKFYTTTYTLGSKNNDFSNKSQKDITPTMTLASVGSKVGNSTTNANANTGLYRSDALTFKLNGYDSNKLNFEGIEASADNKSFTKVSSSLNVTLNADFFKKFSLYNSGKIYFRPKFSYKNSNVKFTLENKNKGTYSNLSENFKTGSSPQLHIGDTIKNISGKSGNAASYQPSFAYRTGSSETDAAKRGFTAAGKGGLSLDSSNSQGAVANYTIPSGVTFTEIQLTYSNPSVTVQADMNTYRNTFTNQVITVAGTEYKCDSDANVQKLHDDMEKKYKANQDANVKLTFEYCHNPEYMNGKVTSDSDFGKPTAAVLSIYKEGGTADRTEKVAPTTSTRNGKTIYTFTFQGNWKDKGWVDNTTATVTIQGQNGYTSQETEIDFLSNSGSYVIAYDDAKNVMKDVNNKTMGSLRNSLTYKNLNPLDTYNFVGIPSNHFVARWGDYSLDTNNDGNISNSQNDNEVAKAEKRLEELGKDKSLASKNAEIYFGNSFAFQPNIFATTKLYYDFVRKSTSTGLNNRLGLQLYEQKATAIQPNVYTKDFLTGATVTVLGTEIMDEGTNGNYYITGAYEKGENYLADVVYQGIHFQARCVGTRTLTQTIKTSDVMFPTNFNVQQNGKDTGVKANGRTAYLQIPAKAGTNHKFSFNFSSSVGVKPNKAKVTLYDKNHTVLNEQLLTRKNTNDNFTCQIDLAKAGAKSGARLTIQGIYNDGQHDYVYPEVESGIIFQRTLSVISVMSSFTSGFGKTLKMFGKIGTKFDLPLDYDLGSLGTKPVSYTDDKGATHSVTQIAFGYNTEVKDELERLQTEHRADNGGNAMSGRGVITKYIDSIMTNGVKSKDDKKDDQKDNKKDDVKDASGKAKSAQDEKATKTDNMKNSSFDFAFSVALILTVETGPSTNPNTSGDNFFDSLMLVAAGSAQMKAETIYTTPIGIDIIVSMQAGGNAVAAFAAGASGKDPYGDVFNLNKDGDDKSFTLTKKDFDIYTKFLLAPTITLGAGVGIGGGKIAKVTLSGTADFDFKFTQPIIGTDTTSAGSGQVSLSADLQLKILFIKKSWNLYKSEKMNLFSYGAQSVNDMLADFQENYLYDAIQAEDLESVSRDYLKHSSKWQPYDVSAMKVEAGEEKILKEGVYPYPDSKIIQLSNGNLLAVFLDDPGTEEKDANNSSTVMYSYSADSGVNWSSPVMADNDRTRDEAPYVYQVTDKKVLLVWSDASEELTDAANGGALKANLERLDISGAWFDVDSAKMGEPFTVAQTKVEGRSNFQDAAPMISYDETTKKLLVYYTATDYEEEVNTEVSTEDVSDEAQKVDAITYGDILNGYSVIGIVSASQKEDGSFTAFDETKLADLGVPVTIEKAEEERAFTGAGIADPKVVDSDVISYNGLSLYAYTIDKDQNDQTLDDRELFVQIYNFDKNEFHYPIQITSDNQADSSPQFVRCRNMTYLYWISGGDVKYINITTLVKGLNDASGNGTLKLKQVDNTLTQTEGDQVNIYYIDADEESVISTAVAHREETDEEGNVTGSLIKEFDVRSNGKTMYMLWTDMVTEQKDENEAGADNIIRETQVFGAYCEPELELKETEQAYTFEDTDSIRYTFENGKGRDTYPVSYTALQDITGDEEDQKVSSGTTVTIDYSTVQDINGQTGKVKAGDKAVRTVQSIVNNGASGWSEPIQITRTSGEDYNYSDLSFYVTDDNGIQAIFSRGRQVLDQETGTFETDESSRLLAVQNFTVTSTLETSELSYARVDNDTETGEEESEEVAAESGNNEPAEEETVSYCYPGDTVEYHVEMTNDGFEPVEDVKYRTYLTVNGEMDKDTVSDWQEAAPAEVSRSEIALDVYNEDDNAEAKNPVEQTKETVNRLVGGKTITLGGVAVLGEDITGTGFVIELQYKDENGETQTKQISKELLVESKVDVTAEAELLDESTANVIVNVSNSGNKDYTGDIKLTDKDKQVGELEDVTIASGGSESYVIEADISESSFGELTANEDGSKQDCLTLALTYGNGEETASDSTVELVRKTSVEGGYAMDAIQSIDIEASDAADANAKAEKVGEKLDVPSNQPVTLNSSFTVNEESDAAKALAKDGCSAEAQMITEWSSSDEDVAYISDKGLLVPMKEGETTITASIYPGQREQTGQTDSSSGVADDESETDFGEITSDAGTGSYVTVNGKYLVPKGAITKKKFTVKVGAATKEDTQTAEDTEKTNTATDNAAKTDETAKTNETAKPATASSAGSTTKNVYVNKIQYRVTTGKSFVKVVGAKKSLKTAKIPATVKIKGKKYRVTAITAGAFKNHKKLKKVIIGSNVKTIYSKAFYGDKKLTQVTIGKKVTKIGSKAFYGDKKLKEITFKCAKVPTISAKAFSGIAKKAVYKVPAKKKTKYKKKLTKKKGYVTTQTIQ